MKPYGVPRDPNIEDSLKSCNDRRRYAMKGSRSFDKKGSRRIWKKKARAESKKIISDSVEEMEDKG